MPLYDLVSDLPLDDRGPVLRDRRGRGLAGVHAQDDDVTLAGGGLGRSGRGRHLRPRRARRRPARRASSSRARWTIDSLSPRASTSSTSSRTASRTRPPTATTGAGRSSRRRSTWRSTRPDARSREALGREPPRPLRFVSSTRARRSTAGSRSTPTCASSSTRPPSGRTSSSPTLAARGDVDVVDLKGAYHGTAVDNPPDAGALPAGRRGASPTPGSRTRRSTPETDAVARAPPRADHLGRADPLLSPTSRRCRSRRAASTASRRASARSRACSSSTTAAPSTGSRLYGGGQFELGVGRGQIQLLAALFHPDGPTTSLPAATTRPSRMPGLPVSPLDPRPAPTGFRAPLGGIRERRDALPRSLRRRSCCSSVRGRSPPRARLARGAARSRACSITTSDAVDRRSARHARASRGRRPSASPLLHLHASSRSR